MNVKNIIPLYGWGSNTEEEIGIAKLECEGVGIHSLISGDASRNKGGGYVPGSDNYEVLEPEKKQE